MAARKKSLFIINFITGVSDGLILPLAACLIALFIFSVDEHWKAILTGCIISVMGAMAFGLARFLGEREEIHHHHPHLAAAEAEKEAALLKAIDIDPDLSRDMLSQMEEEKKLWLKEIGENDLDWEHYDRKRAISSGLHTAGGFLAGGTLVCFVFYFLCVHFFCSPFLAVLPVLAACYSFGWYKGHLLGRNAMRSGMEQLIRCSVIIIAVWIILRFVS